MGEGNQGAHQRSGSEELSAYPAPQQPDSLGACIHWPIALHTTASALSRIGLGDILRLSVAVPGRSPREHEPRGRPSANRGDHPDQTRTSAYPAERNRPETKVPRGPLNCTRHPVTNRGADRAHSERSAGRDVERDAVVAAVGAHLDEPEQSLMERVELDPLGLDLERPSNGPRPALRRRIRRPKPAAAP